MQNENEDDLLGMLPRRKKKIKKEKVPTERETLIELIELATKLDDWEKMNLYLHKSHAENDEQKAERKAKRAASRDQLHKAAMRLHEIRDINGQIPSGLGDLFDYLEAKTLHPNFKKEGKAAMKLHEIRLNVESYGDVQELINKAEEEGDLTPDQAKNMLKQLDKHYEDLGFSNFFLINKIHKIKRERDELFAKRIATLNSDMYHYFMASMRAESQPIVSNDNDLTH